MSSFPKARPVRRSLISVLDRYIAKQFAGPFVFGVAAFSSILVSVGSVFDLIRKMTELGLPFAIASRVFLLQLPEFVSLSFPMATLLSTLMVYTRLSTDSELIALRSAGISVYRLIAPAIVLSLLVTALTFGFNEAIVPMAKYQASTTLESALKADKPTFQERNIRFEQMKDVKQPDGTKVQMLQRLFYARAFDGQRMRGLTVLDFSQEGLNQIITSESAVWNGKQSTWDFYDGTIYIVAPDGSYRNILRFDQQQIQLPRTPLDLASRNPDSAEMNIEEVREYLKIVEQSGDERRIRKLHLRIQQKFAFPFVCLVFGLTGATLGIRPQRAGKGTSFAISILIIFTYYLLSFICDSLGQLELLTPTIAAWLPTILGLSAGAILLTRAAR
ncbi:LptF/LptG family permease [Myxacorys almedinensis]|uniref:LptF/LptG family permease n=1 Tax=Myxacorys almedinensis A TaxID=2690445 RepID=A0A8J7Z2S9_9CYAN|nr:LptF/LptG family permease [Myxacorys almedinensis]NDJ17131.1 LptF/LptG family permease [Myxacorys almedinensis A]